MLTLSESLTKKINEMIKLEFRIGVNEKKFKYNFTSTFNLTLLTSHKQLNL